MTCMEIDTEEDIPTENLSEEVCIDHMEDVEVFQPAAEIEVIGTQDQASQIELLKPHPPKPTVRSKSCQTDNVSMVKNLKCMKCVKKNVKEEKETEDEIFTSKSDKSDTSFHLSDVDSVSSDSTCASSVNQALIRSSNISIMMKNPRYYLGLDVENLEGFIKHLITHGCVEENAVLIVLRKVRLNEPFHVLADIFATSTSVVARLFNHAVPKISSLLKTLIFWPSSDKIKRNLPLQFQANFSNVESIIDCFEIEIEKPMNPSLQASTWSDYKSCNTLKYLISITPSGMINFISQGYGGRASDMKIVEDSGYLDKLSPGVVVLADRGFKNLDSILRARQCFLKRPPSVSAGTKMSKTDVKETKKIASLRVHVERVIKRVREYKFLDAHSRFHHELLRNFDGIVVIAAGLSNCQKPIIQDC
ncbi:uncharacterized protein LOC103513223 isoform X3 [Diaphorina citri]|nr:uncharacterized protein LOC103513223 isoform X3 [Diaphorina citri]